MIRLVTFNHWQARGGIGSTNKEFGPSSETFFEVVPEAMPEKRDVSRLLFRLLPPRKFALLLNYTHVSRTRTRQGREAEEGKGEGEKKRNEERRNWISYGKYNGRSTWNVDKIRFVRGISISPRGGGGRNKGKLK